MGFAAVILVLILARWAVQLILESLNRRNVMAHAHELPPAFKEVMDHATYDKSVAYTLAKGRLSRIEFTLDSVVLLAVLFTGVMPWASRQFLEYFGNAAW